MVTDFLYYRLPARTRIHALETDMQKPVTTRHPSPTRHPEAPCGN
jgi:hypothetical protein